jgi:CheY-like chemotaxis protein
MKAEVFVLKMIDCSNTSLSPVVLVEDDENDLVLMNRAFSRARVEHPLLVAHNGEEAIALLKSDTDTGEGKTLLPSLLITDLKMPKLNGFELLIWLQTQPQFHQIPKLILSSSVLEEDLQKSLQLGATAYLVKPHHFGELVQLVRKWKQRYLGQGDDCVIRPCRSRVRSRF